ncbi:MAG: hypothetical protein IJT46_02995 [Bacteroidaceae bacterium]|nr:hypothetical protein [Bacteroidaceae bacterium]
MNVDWNGLRDEAHEIAKQHGFWDDKLSREHFLCLIVSELMEAVEADRKGRYGNLQALSQVYDIQKKSEYGITDEWLGNWFVVYFNDHVKDSVGDELADAIIRILDLAGKYGVNMNCFSKAHNTVSRVNTFTENIYGIVRDVVNYRFSFSEKLNFARQEICKLAEMMGIDIYSHIRFKMKYNRHRDYLHGKKY